MQRTMVMNPCIRIHSHNTIQTVRKSVLMMLQFHEDHRAMVQSLKKLLNKTGTYMVECTRCMKMLTEKK